MPSGAPHTSAAAAAPWRAARRALRRGRQEKARPGPLREGPASDRLGSASPRQAHLTTYNAPESAWAASLVFDQFGGVLLASPAVGRRQVSRAALILTTFCGQNYNQDFDHLLLSNQKKN